ncbi:MAG TPA: DUF4349 domain-containing protein [Pirellulaceae bacterium]|nr:DUF4349 domain-containing protein [Pirellulaceae bacterium]
MRTSLVVLLLIVGVVGCGMAPGSNFSSDSPASESSASGIDAAIPLTAVAAGTQAAERKIIYKATLWLTVEDFAATEKAITELVKQSGGYVSQFREDRSYGSLRGGQWIVRVPVARFDSVLDGASKLGVPTHREVEAEDITEEHVDLSARLKSKQGIEARLLELVKTKTGEVKDIVAVETELGRVREEIERVEGRLRFLADRVALTTITIHAHEQRGYRPQEATLMGKIAGTFWNSIDGMRTVAEAALLAAVALGPWLVLLLVVILPAVVILRRLARKPRAGADATA